MESDDLVAAGRASGADVTYLAHDGIHDWPYVREDLTEAMARGLFEPVPDDPASWTYRSVAQPARRGASATRSRARPRRS